MIPIGEQLPDSWEWKKIGQVCKFLDSQRIPLNNEERERRIRGKSISQLYPYYGANGQVGWIDDYIFDEPLILLAEDGGHFGSTDKPIAYAIQGKTWVNNHAHALRPNSNMIDFSYCLYSLMIRPDVEQLISGTTRGKLNQAAAAQISIPLPPLDEQKRIAAILEEADHARRTRRFTQSVSDTFLQETFVQMFGDPVTNPMGWEVVKLENACSELYRYPTFYGFDYIELGTPVVRIGNILQNGILNPDLTDYVFMDSKLSKKYPRTILEKYDTLMAVRGDGSTASRIGLVTSDNLIGANISPNLIRFKANSDLMHPLFLYHLLTSKGGQVLLGQWVTKTAKKTITARDIKAIRIPLPDRDLQEDFANVVDEYYFAQAQQQESSRQAEHLFQTLLHQAFRGEL